MGGGDAFDGRGSLRRSGTGQFIAFPETIDDLLFFQLCRRFFGFQADTFALHIQDLTAFCLGFLFCQSLLFLDLFALLQSLLQVLALLRKGRVLLGQNRILLLDLRQNGVIVGTVAVHQRLLLHTVAGHSLFQSLQTADGIGSRGFFCLQSAVVHADGGHALAQAVALLGSYALAVGYHGQFLFRLGDLTLQGGDLFRQVLFPSVVQEHPLVNGGNLTFGRRNGVADGLGQHGILLFLAL